MTGYYQEKPQMTYSPYNSNTAVVQTPQAAYGAYQASPMPGGVPIAVQPGPSQDMRFSAGLARDAQGQREWKNGLCNCFDDCGTCVLAWCCPCFTYNHVMSRARALENTGQPHPDGGEYFGSDCLIYAALNWFGCGPALQITSRQRLRKRYGIRGGFVGDCCSACCCYPCEMTQESQELREEEDFLRGPGYHITQ